ncbi:CBS domain-containing protein [Reyranella sp.]|uniref:CBS domain-containing protein n=1 Tax=Reyranella sp. TaxID=1929291 RepID=UPI00273003E6|nr:CBS domain-containing protein [Reyranella sp.]MDP2372134.1 CBS domain-containing protein [Reyranella sp.]
MRARDIMSTDVVCIESTASVFDAAELLLSAGVSAAPVVNPKGTVVGIVSEADLLRRVEIGTAAKKSWLARLVSSEGAAAHEFVAAHGRRIADVMTREVVTAGEDTPLGELVELLERHKIKRLPIVRNGLLAGVVSRSDLLRAVLSREPDQPVLQPTDRALRELVVAVLENQPWTSKWPVNVFANDGVVHLWGFVEGEEVRKAYRVAAENVPGVRRVKNHLRGLPHSVGMGV